MAGINTGLFVTSLPDKFRAISGPLDTRRTRKAA